MSLSDVVRGARIGEAVVFAVGLIGLLLWWTLVGDPGPAQSVRQVPGVVAHVADRACTIALEDQRRVHVACDPRWRLSPGARVVLTATRHAKGDETYLLTESGVPDS